MSGPGSEARARLTERTAYFLVGAAFATGAAFAAFAGSSMIAASAARRFTASMPLRHDSFDSYVSLVATTRPLLENSTKCVLPPRPCLMTNLPLRAKATSLLIVDSNDDAHHRRGSRPRASQPACDVAIGPREQSQAGGR